ncbi:uncharacterized protein LOC130694046 [Daphnia carinata]|uniref:uncharacterized protein LOC130694046 n=1 Tax=Daphnia carinata TaxID=120202 RepID=UPI00257C095B|nr:uncharacterized protein LOC130694046 [Daphnia carinata]
METGDVPTASNLTPRGTSASADKAGKKTKKLPDATHGLKFESKLVALFCIRALGAGYKFEVTKEREDLGGKFDDLIFRYQVSDGTPEGKRWRYRYLQAKHKQNETDKINATHLLGDNDRGDFSLPKYFRSFCMMRRRGDDIHDCIICTNIGFHLDVEKNGIKLVSINDQWEGILEFERKDGENPKEKTARYKLEFTEELRRKALNEWPDIQRLAEQLQECAQGNKTTDIRSGIFSSYHVALIKESVIDLKTKKFHHDFVNGVESLSVGAAQLRQILSERPGYVDWKFQLNNNFGKSQTNGETENGLPLKIEDADLDAFLATFVLVVNMPNEKQFEDILQSKDISKYYIEKECKQQTICLMHDIDQKFSDKDVNDWLTSEEAKEILLDGVTEASQHYQEELKEDVGFDEIPSDKMIDKLKKLPANGNRIERIITPSPKHTAVEFLSAIKKVEEYTRDESFLVVPLSSLKDKKRWTNILKLKKNSHHLLVVVCDRETPDPCGYEDLVPVDQTVNKIVFICRGDITYAELSEKFQKDILEKTISFQGTKLTVDELVGNEPDKVIDHLSIEELLFQEEKEVNIPQSDTSAYEEYLYIERRLMTAFNESFETKLTNRLNCTLDELHQKCKFTAQGEIKWFVKEADRQSIWLEIKRLTDEEVSSHAIDESQLVRLDEGSERSPVVIISDGAGTGKSTLLFHYYMEKKRAKPDHWIIRTNLAEHQTALAQLATTAEDDAVDFLVNKLHIVANDSPFSRSLLRHRIKTGKRIAFMFDGFDEISHVCQQKLIHLMKILAEKETIGLYVTTRPHMVDELQSGLFQLAHHLQILSEEDQINYLINYWQENLHEIEQENKSIIIRKFAEALAQRISETLKHEEMCFIGVPLQCRILAEYYLPEVGKRIEDDKVGECVTLEDQDFDLKGLFGRLLKTKRRIYQEEKGKSSISNNTGRGTMHFSTLNIEFHLTKLAVKTLVANDSNANILWPFQHPHELSDNEKDLTDSGVKYGLVLRSKCEETSYVQFVHRTYAEYLFARYLYQEMDINNVANYRLFDEKPICDLVINEILIQDNYHGVRVFLNSMLTKTENDQRTNPTDLLKKFATHLAKHIHLTRRYRIHPHGNTLIVALQTEHLFHFLLDCLDGTLDESEAKRVVTFAFEEPFDFSIFLHLGEKPRYLSDFCKLFHSVKGNDKVLKRILSYYGDADVVDGKRIVKQLYQNLFVSRIFSSNYVYLRNNDKAKHVLNTTLDFVENHTLHLKLALDLEQPPFGPLDMSVILLHFYIFNEDDSNVLVKFLRILSSIYSEDNNFTELIKCTLNMQANNEDKVNYPPSNGIETTLKILRELSRPTVMQGLCHLALVTNLFEKYYLPDQDSLVDPPPRMTALHWAAFNGDLETIESMGHETCNADDGFTPFYVAAARHQEEFCNKILSLLKTRWNATDNELRKHLTNDKGFVFTAMWDAVCFENVKMFQVILKSVKQALGRNYLMDLLKSKKAIESFASQVYDGQDTLLLALKTGIDRKLLFKTIAKVMLEDGSQVGYTNLNDLVFQSKETVKTVNYIVEETLHGMMNVNGQEMWRQRFMNCDRHWGFTLLSSHEWWNLTLRIRSLQTSL